MNEISELTNFRKKYPEYKDLDDVTLANKLAQKYPDSYGDLPNKVKNTGFRFQAEEITRPTPFIEKVLPSAEQFLGGIGGATIGSFFGRPYGGGAVGGTLGRGLGTLRAKQLEYARRQPFPKRILNTAEAIVPFRAYSRFNSEEKQKFGKMIRDTAVIESIFAGAGSASSKAIKWLNRGVLNQWLGPRVTERGLERGWARILNPEFYKNEIPRFIKSKVGNFFPNLSKAAGTQIDDLINKKYKDSLIDMTKIKYNVLNDLPKSGDPTDLLEIHAPKAQKDLIQTITNTITKARGNVRKASTIWNLRKELDKTIYGKSWTPDAYRYLMKIRNSLNAPIKELGEDVGEHFTKYSWVKDAELKYGRNFEVRTGPKGDIYSPEIESFVKNLLDPGKDEIIKELTELDMLLPTNQKIMDELLDYAAAETLDKPISQIGLIGRTGLGMLGGRKFFARTGALGQKPVVAGIGKGIGRFMPTFMSEEYSPKLGGQ